MSLDEPRPLLFFTRPFGEEGHGTSYFLANKSVVARNSTSFTRFCCEEYLFTIFAFEKFAFGFARHGAFIAKSTYSLFLVEKRPALSRGLSL